MHDCLQPSPGTLSRRTLIVRGAAAAAGATLSGALASTAVAAEDDHERTPAPVPKPIPGGLDIPDFGLIHTFIPGPPNVTLPFSGSTLMGLDVEPNTITDFKGFTALAYLTGTATGSDGEAYNFESDFRVFHGKYVAEDESTNRETFGFI
jgi:hypothetical protein